jgi:hypothetical protein
VQQTTDNGYIATGHTSQSWFDSGLWLIKIDSEDTTNTEQIAADKKICIDGNIKCSTKPFFYGQDENFFVTLNNTGDDEIAAMVEFHLWDPIEKEWEFFGEARDTISPMSREDTNPWDVSLSWSFKMLNIEWIRAELYVDDELVVIKENRFFMGFFIF